MAVAVILSAQCTDKKVNEVTPALFRRYKTLSDFANAKRAELERLIFQTGFYRNKAKNIIGFAKGLEKLGGIFPDSLSELTKLPGIGRKTGNVILSNLYGKNEGVVVDSHVFRISRLLGLARGKTPEKVERDLIAIIPGKDRLVFSNSLVFHGRAVCVARRPKCPECPLANLCPSAKKSQD